MKVWLEPQSPSHQKPGEACAVDEMTPQSSPPASLGSPGYQFS